MRTHRSSGNPPATDTERRRGNLDAADQRIIELLQRDGRMPYARISNEVGLSEAAVRQRVQRLVEHEVVQIVAVTDPLQLGYRRQAMIGVRTEGEIDAVAVALGELSEADYVVYTTGRFDLLVEIVCEDDTRLLELLNEIRRIPGVQSTEAMMYLKLHKQTYAWGAK